MYVNEGKLRIFHVVNFGWNLPNIVF
jgi:hypothetical protein